MLNSITVSFSYKSIRHLIKFLQEQLRDLKSEIQILKVEEKLTPFDRIHDDNVDKGENKYSTLRRSRSGTTKARVAFYEEL